MRIVERVLVAAPAQAVWERISDPTRWPANLGRMHCRHVEGSAPSGPGARYWLHLEVGAAEVGSLIEVLEHEAGAGLSWTTIRGFEQRGHWRLRERDADSSEVTLSVAYQASGGLAALVTDELSAIFVRRYVHDALTSLAQQLAGGQADTRAAGPGALLDAGARVIGEGARTTSALARAGLLRPARPDRHARSLTALARRGPTLPGRYAAAAALYPREPALIDETAAVTFATLQDRTDRLASALAGHGVHAGERIAVVCRNHRLLIEALLAGCKLGAETLALDTDLASASLGELITRERPRAVIYDAELAPRLGGCLRGRKAFIAAPELGARPRHAALEQLIAEADIDARPAPRGDGRIATLSAAGTPPRAGGSWPSPTALPCILERIPMRVRERVLLAAPLSGCWGVMQLSLASLLASTLVLQRRVDAEATLAGIERERIAHCVTVPRLLEDILALAPEVRRGYDTSSLQRVTVSGTLAGELATRFMDEYGDILYSAYETPQLALVAIACPTDLRRAPGTAGRPLRHMIVRVLDEHGAPVRAGESGRIYVANDIPWGGADSHAGRRPEGFLATGDVGHLDDHGRLFVEGECYVRAG
ncbi:MAG TPA: AMP-binding protein [Solirubrobacteraceae bacterium]|nr:AMP-binding protein [Solirubrobacteraceae bacterium]